MSEIPSVIPGEDVESDWGNIIRDRVLMRYANQAVRTSQSPSPQEGELSYLADEDRIDLFTSGAWLAIASEDFSVAYTDAAIAAAIAALPSQSGMNGSVAVLTPPGTEATSGDAPQDFPPSFTTTFNAPANAAFVVVTAALSQVSASGVLNHSIGININGTTHTPTRQRGEEIRDITLGAGPRAVTPGEAITLKTVSDRLSGTSEMSTSAEKRNVFDYRFLTA